MVTALSTRPSLYTSGRRMASVLSAEPSVARARSAA
jgi:hypothetical protein